METGSHIQITTTTDTRERAEAIARALVGQRLVACAQICGPIASTYWWKGKIECADEWMIVMKTREALYEKAEQAIRALHPYETPEIIAVPIKAGLAEYLRWIEGET